MTSHEVVVNLIGSTKTRKGLRIKSVLDSNKYQTGINVPKEELDKVNLVKKEFHGEWNYSIKQQEDEKQAVGA